MSFGLNYFIYLFELWLMGLWGLVCVGTVWRVCLVAVCVKKSDK